MIMEKQVEALISWISYEEGGRRRPPSIGTRYCPIVKFINMSDNSNKAWSADFICTKVDENNNSRVNFSFLVDEAPVQYLSSGNRFELFEGKRKVARGVIT